MKSIEYLKMYNLEQSHWFFVAKRMFISAFLKKITPPNGSLIFDAGCGSGGNHLFLQNYGKVVSLDISPEAIRFCHERGLSGLVRGDLNSVNFKEGSFDMIAALDVLYHTWVQDDRTILNNFYRVLKPGGRLLLTDSAFHFLMSRHDKAVMARERYTVSGLKKKMEEAHFKVLRSSYMFFTTFPILTIIRILQKFSFSEKEAESNIFPLPEWVNKIVLGLMRGEAAFLSRFSLPVGSSVIILAEKSK